MIKNHFKKIVSIISILVFSTSQISAQGPNSIEAAAFEPIDATDIVNLVTGDMTYVLPLLNVPSPEGGYPLTLSYHAGIAAEQEASWVGLGWNLNPGAINRAVKGYPDDWKEGVLHERFYDVGGEEINRTLTLSYTSLEGRSIGVSVSHNSNRGFGGSISLGSGIQIGEGFLGTRTTYGIRPGGNFFYSFNGGYKTKSGFNIGGYISTDRSMGVSLKKGGTSLNLDSRQGVGLSVSSDVMDVYLSTEGVNVSIGMGASSVNQSFSFSNSVNSGDYTVERDRDQYGLYVPTPVGFFGLGYSEERIRWYLNSEKNTYISGGIYLDSAVKFPCQLTYSIESITFGNAISNTTSHTDIIYVENKSDCSCNKLNSLIPGVIDFFKNDYNVTVACVEAILLSETPNSDGSHLMDVYEFGNYTGKKEFLNNNMMMPAFDSYQVNAQGMNGAMIPTIDRGRGLLGLSRNFDDTDLYETKFELSGAGNSGNSSVNYNSSVNVNFAFNNQYSSSFLVNHADFNVNSSPNEIFDYLNSNDSYSKRKRDGKVVQYFTYKDINENSFFNGMLLANGHDYKKAVDPELRFHYGGVDENAIAGYVITAKDGKSYHYALPVINFETKTRIKGVIDNKPENESYFETSQDPYVTHWLLTAITGPDYVKKSSNSIKYPSEKDEGYWVRFDYGLWTDNFVWKSPMNKEWEPSEEDPTISSKIYGKKQVYYLDRIKTRTHTALFVKNTREDAESPKWDYYAFDNVEEIFSENYNLKWSIPKQKPLRLDKIILIKNKHDNLDKTSGNDLAVQQTLSFPTLFTGDRTINNEDNIIDIHDNISSIESNALKIIDFASHYNYNLAKSNITSGKLTLNGVSVKGKRGANLIPPFKFEYGSNLLLDYNKIDAWGYYKNNPKAWSMNKIINPTGGEIIIDYEEDDFGLVVEDVNNEFFDEFSMSFMIPFGINEGNIDITIKPIDNNFRIIDYFNSNTPVELDVWYNNISDIYGSGRKRIVLDIEEEVGQVLSINDSNNSMVIRVNSKTINDNSDPFKTGTLINNLIYNRKETNSVNQKFPRPFEPIVNGTGLTFKYFIKGNKNTLIKKGGGIRVSSLVIRGNDKNFTTKYEYNLPGYDSGMNDLNYKSSGVISYIPLEEGNVKNLSYGTELPSPIPLYSNVTVKNNYDSSSKEFSDKQVYTFKTLDPKEKGNVKYGDLLEINEENLYRGTEQNSGSGVTRLTEISKFTVNDNLALLGSLQNTKLYNSKNQLLKEEKLDYYSKEELTKGIIKQTFQSYKTIIDKKENDFMSLSSLYDKWVINSTSKVVYPVVLKSRTVKEGGYTNKMEYTQHDDVTGDPIETISYNSRGDKIKETKLPAYHVSEYGKMGPKITSEFRYYDNSNKNMLSQIAADYMYLYKNNEWKPIGVGINTWSNLNQESYDFLGNSIQSSGEVWRKHRSYTWNGSLDTDGTFLNYTDDFNWTLGASQNANWELLSETNKYNSYSQPIEVKDVNGNYTSTKMGYKNSKVIATCNSAHSDMYYSGAEYEEGSTYSGYVDGGVKFLGYQEVGNEAHTGVGIVEVSQGGKSFEVDVPARTDRNTPLKQRFKVSVWVKKGGEDNVKILLDNSQYPFNDSEKVYAGNWVLLNGYIIIPQSGANIGITSTSGTVRLDDFRLHPVVSSMTSYVYNEWDEVTYIMGANGLSIHYTYDDAGRLVETQTELSDKVTGDGTGGFKRTSTNTYNYKRNYE